MLKLLGLLAFLLLGADAGFLGGGPYPNESYIEDIDVYDNESLLDLFSDYNGIADLEAENGEVLWYYNVKVFPDALLDCDPLRLCQYEIEDFKENSTILDVAKEANVLDSICGDLGQLTSCIAQNETSCQVENVRIETMVVKDIFNYTCSPAGRHLVMSLADSNCTNNPQVEKRFNNVLQACMDTFQADVSLEYTNWLHLSNLCELLDQLKTCFVNESRDLCGSQMSDFVSNIWDITADGCRNAPRYKASVYDIDEEVELVISLANKTSRFIG